MLSDALQECLLAYIEGVQDEFPLEFVVGVWWDETIPSAEPGQTGAYVVLVMHGTDENPVGQVYGQVNLSDEMLRQWNPEVMEPNLFRIGQQTGHDMESILFSEIYW